MRKFAWLAIGCLIDRREHHEEPAMGWRVRHRSRQLHLKRRGLGRLSSHGKRGRADTKQTDQRQGDGDRIPGAQKLIRHGPVLRPGGSISAETEKVAEWV